MSLFVTATFLFLCGLTLSGLVGSLCELVAGRRLGLRAPFVTKGRPLLSIALTAACGPMMLVNEGLESARGGRRGPAYLTICLMVSVVWAFASGVVVVDIARMAGGWGG